MPIDACGLPRRADRFTRVRPIHPYLWPIASCTRRVPSLSRSVAAVGSSVISAAIGPGIRRLATIDDPSNDQFRDYTTLEWWRFPARTGARHLTGPYVDYVCTDDYTVTITTPVTVGGQLSGVVGMDVLVDRLERELLPLLRAAGVPIAVVNASGRIVTSTDSRREPGSMLRLEGLDDALAPLRAPEPMSVSRRLPGGAEVVACGDTSLALVVGL